MANPTLSSQPSYSCCESIRMRLLGPMFIKELLEIARRWRYYVARIALGVIMLTVLSFILLEVAPSSYSPSKLSQVGHYLGDGWMWTQLCVLVLLTPALFGGLIAAEKDKRSLEILFTTDLSNFGILWDKFASRLLLVLLFLLSSLPVVVLLGLLGGIDYGQMFLASCLTVSSVCAVGSTALYYSVVSSKPWIAMLRTYFTWTLIWFLLPFSMIMTSEITRARRGPPSPWDVPTLAFFHPVFDVAAMTHPGIPPLVYGVEMSIAVACAFLLSTSVALFGLSCLRLRSFANRPSVPLTWRILLQIGQPFRSLLAWAIRKTKTSESIATEHGTRKRRFSHRWADFNPIWFRNASSNLFDAERHLSTIQYLGCAMTLVVLVCFALESPRSMGYPRKYCTIVSGQMIGLQLILVVIAAGSISRERERGTLEILLTTSLTPAEVVLGTIPSLARAVFPTLFMIFATVLTGTLAGAFPPGFACSYLLVLAAMTLSVGAGALLVSIACTRVSTATALAMVAPLSMWHITLLVPLRFPFSAIGYYVIVALFSLCLLFQPQRYRLFGAVLLACSVPLASVGPVCSVNRTITLSTVYSYPHWITKVSQSAVWDVSGGRRIGWGDTLDRYAEWFVVGHVLASVILILIAVGFFTRLIGKKGRYQE